VPYSLASAWPTRAPSKSNCTRPPGVKPVAVAVTRVFAGPDEGERARGGVPCGLGWPTDVDGEVGNKLVVGDGEVDSELMDAGERVIAEGLFCAVGVADGGDANEPVDVNE
jgi:hypothetical protein